MDNGIFRAGVQPGSPTSHDEIKMLICFILTQVNEPMGFDLLHESLLENSLVNYFELIQAVDGLVKTKHLARTDAGPPEQYAITPLGRQAAEEFKSALPYSAREKAALSAQRLLRRHKRESEVDISVRKVEGGYHMELSIPEKGSDLLGFSLFLPTSDECDLVRRRFLNDPVFIYKGVLALLTGDQEVLGDIFPQEDSLGL